MEQNRRYTDIISTNLTDNDRLAIDQHNLAMKSRQTNTPVDNLTLGERKNETDEHGELLRAGAKARLLKLAGIDTKESCAIDTGKDGANGQEMTDPAPEVERTLSPEQKEIISTRLKEKFEAKKNQKLYKGTGITWEKVESAMEDEDWLCAYRAEQLGHEPAIFMADDEGFWFGTMTDETPQSTRNCVLDEEAAEPLRKQFPDLESAVKSAKDIGFDGLMTVSQGNHIARNTKLYYEKDWNYYETPEDVRRVGGAIDGNRYGSYLYVFRNVAFVHHNAWGWRGTRRVLYKKTA